jgi:hypothetical protein
MGGNKHEEETTKKTTPAEPAPSSDKPNQEHDSGKSEAPKKE